MTAPARGQTDARAVWTSFYPFEPYNGGLGSSLACSSVSASTILQGSFSAAENVNVAVVVNTGSVFAFVRFGDASVVATTACMAVPPGASVTCSLFGSGQATPQYMAGITASSTATLQVTTGWGN